MTITDSAAADDSRAWFRIEKRARLARLLAGGEWCVRDVPRIDLELRALDLGDAAEAAIDGMAITKLDAAGAWLLVRTKREMEEAGKRVSQFTLPDIYAPLIHTIEQEHTAPPVQIAERHTFQAFLERTGRATIGTLRQGYGMLGYLGRFTIELGEAIYAPRGNLRGAALIHQIEEIGINALPIVGLLAFLIGIVMAYQGADQLRRFGAEIFTINLLGVGVLREIGGLITAIIVAGRSGSAFTAHLGSMRVKQ